MTYERALPKSRPVFISCSTEDIRTARFIRSAINQLPTFYGYIARDERAQFAYPSEKIASMLEMCSAFIILYTKKAIKSPMVNQELGFFFNRWRRNPQVSPILLVKSTEIKDEIEGFAYGREPILFDPLKPEYIAGQIFWTLHLMFSINELEIQCSNHIQRAKLPDPEIINQSASSKESINIPGCCSVCGKPLYLDPCTLMRTSKTKL